MDQPGPVDGHRAVAARGAARAASAGGAGGPDRRDAEARALLGRGFEAAAARALDDLLRARLPARERHAARRGGGARRLRGDAAMQALELAQDRYLAARPGTRGTDAQPPHAGTLPARRDRLRRVRLPARRSDRRGPLPAAAIALAGHGPPRHRRRARGRAGRGMPSRARRRHDRCPARCANPSAAPGIASSSCSSNEWKAESGTRTRVKPEPVDDAATPVTLTPRPSRGGTSRSCSTSVGSPVSLRGPGASCPAIRSSKRPRSPGPAGRGRPRRLADDR